MDKEKVYRGCQLRAIPNGFRGGKWTPVVLVRMVREGRMEMRRFMGRTNSAASEEDAVRMSLEVGMREVDRWLKNRQ